MKLGLGPLRCLGDQVQHLGGGTPEKVSQGLPSG